MLHGHVSQALLKVRINPGAAQGPFAVVELTTRNGDGSVGAFIDHPAELEAFAAELMVVAGELRASRAAKVHADEAQAAWDDAKLHDSPAAVLAEAMTVRADPRRFGGDEPKRAA